MNVKKNRACGRIGEHNKIATAEAQKDITTPGSRRDSQPVDVECQKTRIRRWNKLSPNSHFNPYSYYNQYLTQEYNNAWCYHQYPCEG
jgi:hypothetical protein